MLFAIASAAPVAALGVIWAPCGGVFAAFLANAYQLSIARFFLAGMLLSVLCFLPWVYPMRRMGSGRVPPSPLYIFYVLFRLAYGISILFSRVYDLLLSAAPDYGAYNVHQGLHQRCWTHLLRDIRQLKEKYPGHQGLVEWAQQVREVYDHAQAYPGPDPGLPETVQHAQRVKQQQQFQEQLLDICKPYVGSDAPMSVLCQRVERFLPELFTFVADPLVSADNNAAERSLRPAVVSRKISGRTRSPEGSTTKSVLASLFGTWRLRGRNPCHALNSILSQPQLAPV